MADPLLLTASYMTKQFNTSSYGQVVWTALKNPPTSGTTAYTSSVTKAQNKGVSIYANRAAFPATGTVGKVYVAKDTSTYYRWSGSAYVVRDNRSKYITGSRHADWLRDFYDRSSTYSG